MSQKDFLQTKIWRSGESDPPNMDEEDENPVIQIDTMTKERRESMQIAQGNQLAPIIFRYYFEDPVTRQPIRDSASLLEGLKPISDNISDGEGETKIRTVVFLRSQIEEAIERNPLKLRYFDSQYKAWKDVPSHQDGWKLNSNTWYRNEEQISINLQGFTKEWIIDLLVKPDGNQLPAVRQATDRIEVLEQLIMNIGNSIFEAFPNQRQSGRARRSVANRSQYMESPDCQEGGKRKTAYQDNEQFSTDSGENQDTPSSQADHDELSRANMIDNDSMIIGPIGSNENPEKLFGKDSESKSRDHSGKRSGGNKTNPSPFNSSQSKRLPQLNKHYSLMPKSHKRFDGRIDHPQSEHFQNMGPPLQLGNRNQSQHSGLYYGSRIRKVSHLIEEDIPESSLDLAFLYSDPLLDEIEVQNAKTKQFEKKIVTFNQPLNTDYEFDKIVETLKKSEKRFKIRKEVATQQNLKDVMACRPSILHISCHGDSMVDPKTRSKKSTFFLAFEDPDRICMLDRLEEDRLCSLLGDGKNSSVKLVFVSACHSEAIGQLFKRIGVPVVIAINSMTMILDDVCRIFARNFYNYLIEGNSPQKSFKEAKNAVKGHKNIDCFSCCCAHMHKPWCKWKSFYSKKENTENDKDQAHNCHIPNHQESNCKCKNQINNLHSKGCKFALSFKKRFDLTFEELAQFSLNDLEFPDLMDKTQKVCCCSPEIPHDETQKFMIIKLQQQVKITLPNINLDQSDSGEESESIWTEQKIQEFEIYEKRVLNTPLFNKREKGLLEIKGDHDANNQLLSVIDQNMLVGRNEIISDIVKFLNESHQRLLHLYGPDGHGKSDIANYSGKYALYGRVELEGALYVEAENKNTVSGLIQKICKRFTEKGLIPQIDGEYSTEHIISVVRQRKYVIIIDKIREIIVQQKEQLNRFLASLINKTQKTKLIIISNDPEDFGETIKNKNGLEVTELRPYHAAKLLMIAAKDSKHLISFKSEQELSKHKVFNMIPLSPKGIVMMAQLLRHKSLDDIVAEKLKVEQERAFEEEAAAQKIIEAQISTFKDNKDEELKNQEPNESMLKPTQSNLNNYNQDEALNFIIQMNFDELLKNFPMEQYPQEYELLYILCQMPSGLFEKDLDRICLLNQNYSNWRRFFNKISISQGQSFIEETPGENQKVEQLPMQIISGLPNEKSKSSTDDPEKESKTVFSLMTSNFDTELLEVNYVPEKKVRQFIISHLLKSQQQQKIKEYFDESLKYLALLSRKFLRMTSEDNQNKLDIYLISAALDEGIWKEDYGIIKGKIPSSFMDGDYENPIFENKANKWDETFMNNFGSMQLQSQIVQQKQDELLIKYYIYEPNFSRFLDQELLQQHYQTLSYWEDGAAGDIQELCVTNVSLLIELKQYEEAAQIIQRCEKIAEVFNLEPLKAKLIILKVSLCIRKRDFEDCESLIQMLRGAGNIFQQSKVQKLVLDGKADALYLQAIIQIEIYNQEEQKNSIVKRSNSQNNNDTTGIQMPMSLQQTSSDPNILLPEHLRWRIAKQMDEIQNTRNKLHNARKIYDSQNIKYGIAKAYLVEAEFLIQLIFSDFANNLTKSDFYEDIESYLYKARKIFVELGYSSLEARCLKQTGIFWLYRCMRQDEFHSDFKLSTHEEIKIKLLQNLETAKSQFDNSLAIFSRIKDKNEVFQVNNLINETFEEIRKNSHNVLIFATSYPLVEDAFRTNTHQEFISQSRRGSMMRRNSINKQNRVQMNELAKNNYMQVKQIGPLTKYINELKPKIVEMAKKLQSNIKQPINVKFDQLNIELLEYVRDFGCKMLYLTSHVFDEDRLCIEGQSGAVEYITIDMIEQFFKHNPIKVEVVILAMPKSIKIAQTFIKLGVPHVVAFNFDTFVQHSSLIPRINDYIQKFSLSFYQALLKIKSVFKAYEICVNESFDDLSYIQNRFLLIEKLKKCNNYDQDYLTNGPQLFRENDNVHNRVIFNLPNNVKYEQSGFMDSSKKRLPNNFDIYLQKNAFTGRKEQIYKIIDQLKQVNLRIVNVFGLEGIGKTRLVLETSNYLSEREIFKDGIFYVDMKEMKSISEFKDHVFNILKKECYLEEIADGEIEKDTMDSNNALLVLDNIDTILTSNTQFAWDLITLLNIYKQFKLILISKNEITKNNIGFVTIIDQIKNLEVPPLSDEESAELVISNCERDILEDLHDQIEAKVNPENHFSSVQQFLLNDKNLINCFGFPFYLVMLSKLLASQKIEKINIKSKIEPQNHIKRMQECYNRWQKTKEQIYLIQSQNNNVQSTANFAQEPMQIDHFQFGNDEDQNNIFNQIRSFEEKPLIEDKRRDSFMMIAQSSKSDHSQKQPRAPKIIEEKKKDFKLQPMNQDDENEQIQIALQQSLSGVYENSSTMKECDQSPTFLETHSLLDNSNNQSYFENKSFIEEQKRQESQNSNFQSPPQRIGYKKNKK